MPELRDFTVEDLKKIRSRSFEKELADIIDSHIIELLVSMGPAWTAWERDNVIACAGVSILWPHVGEAWLHTCPDISKHKLWFYKNLKTQLYAVIAFHYLHRVQADVDMRFTDSLRMMEHLGFSIESTMKFYGPNKEDFVRYVLFPGEKA